LLAQANLFFTLILYGNCTHHCCSTEHNIILYTYLRAFPWRRYLHALATHVIVVITSNKLQNNYYITATYFYISLSPFLPLFVCRPRFIIVHRTYRLDYSSRKTDFTACQISPRTGCRKMFELCMNNMIVLKQLKQVWMYGQICIFTGK